MHSNYVQAIDIIYILIFLMFIQQVVKQWFVIKLIETKSDKIKALYGNKQLICFILKKF